MPDIRNDMEIVKFGLVTKRAAKQIDEFIIILVALFLRGYPFKLTSLNPVI